MDEKCVHCGIYRHHQTHLSFHTCLTCHCSVCVSCRKYHTSHSDEHFFTIPLVQYNNLCKKHREVNKHFCETCGISLCDKCNKVCLKENHSTCDIKKTNERIKKILKTEREKVDTELKLLETESRKGFLVYDRLNTELQGLSDHLKQVNDQVTELLWRKMTQIQSLRFGIDQTIDNFLSEMHHFTVRRRFYNHLDNAITKLLASSKDQCFPMMHHDYVYYRQRCVVPQHKQVSIKPMKVWYTPPKSGELQDLLLRWGVYDSEGQMQKQGNTHDDDKSEILNEKERLITSLDDELKKKDHEIRVAKKTIRWMVNFAEALILENKTADIDMALSKEMSSFIEIRRDVDHYIKQMSGVQKATQSKDAIISKLKQDVEDKKGKSKRENSKATDERPRETETQIESLKSQLKELEESMDIVIKENSQLQHELAKTVTEKDEMRSSYEDLSKHVASLKQKLDDSNKEREDLRSRLSQVSGAKLTAGNPGITDLGDRFRPTKISEMFSELYDSEWTEAMDELKDLKPEWSEMVVVRHLFIVLQGCFVACRKIANDQMCDIVKSITAGAEKEQTNEWLEEHVTASKQIRDARKGLAMEMSQHIQKVIFERQLLEGQCTTFGSTDTSLITEIKTKPFTERCITLSWLMVVQDPAMHIDMATHPGTPLDKSKYREYTKSGPRVEYVVWPALYLTKDGPLMNKGVVQITK